MSRAAVISSLVVAVITVACGGSSSETPFPQRPIEDRLMQRHAAANADAVSAPEAEEPAKKTATDPADE